MIEHLNQSIRKRFISVLALVITIAVVLFAAISIAWDVRTTERELENQADHMLSLSLESLSSALWQYNNEYVNDYIDSLFRYENLAFAQVVIGEQIAKTRVSQKYSNINFLKSDLEGFIWRSGEVSYNDTVVGEVRIAISRERIGQLVVYESLASLVLVGVIIFLIFGTVYFLSDKYIFSPLHRLENSARSISAGNLDAEINIGTHDEIGQLAKTFKQMIVNIKNITASRDDLNREIAKREEVESALKISKETLLSVMNGIEATVYVADIDSHEILFMNKYMIELYGSDMKGKNCYEGFRNLGAPCELCNNKQLLDDTGKPNPPVVWSDFNTFTNRWYLHHDRAIQWVDGRYVKLQIATDITELKTMENGLRQAHKMESLGRLAGGIAHDFNNILSAINGFSQLALDSIPPDSSAVEDLEEVIRSGNRAARLVKQILAFSRKEEQKLQTLCLQDLLDEAIQLVRATLPSTIEFDLEIYSERKLFIDGDETSFHQIVLNLCTNAAHAMEETGGKIHISLKPSSRRKHGIDPLEVVKDNYVELIIKDTGCGIAKEHLDEIFDPYFTTKDIGKGSGMGLAVVHGAVKSHSGFIEVESDMNKGTLFRLYFPEMKGGKEIVGDEQDKFPRGDERILVVDDEKSIVRLMVRRLESLGYSVKSAHDSRDAFNMVSEDLKSFDLIISDQTMPHLRGDQLAQKIHALRKDLPIIICSGYSQYIDTGTSKQFNIAQVIDKPVEFSTLADSVRKVLDKAG